MQPEPELVDRGLDPDDPFWRTCQLVRSHAVGPAHRSAATISAA